MKQRREKKGEGGTLEDRENEEQVSKNGEWRKRNRKSSCAWEVQVSYLLCQELHTHDSFIPHNNSGVCIVSLSLYA